MSMSAQDALIADILSKGSPLVKDVLNNHERYEVQILYTEIIRNESGRASLKTHELFVNDDNYFYPASTVKFPVALYAVEKLNTINSRRIGLTTPIAFGQSAPPQNAIYTDSTSSDGNLSIDHLIKKVFLTSDNEAYNLLYSFVGQEQINARLQRFDTRLNKITHRVGNSAYDAESNRYSHPFLFYENGEILYVEPQKYNRNTYDDRRVENCLKGKGYMQGGKLVEEPFDFSQKNYLSLRTLHDMMASFLFPSITWSNKQFNISADQRSTLLSHMGARPRESRFPSYDDKYYDSYVKFFVVGDREERMPEGLRIFNKVGYAYGYLTDVAYIVDLNANVEFILSATIHVNDNGIYNDDTYEYDSVGIPFLAEIGRLILEHERSKPSSNNLDHIRTLTYD